MHRLEQGLKNKAAQVHPWMGQHQTGMFEPQLTPKQQIQIQAARSPALLQRAIATAAQLQTLQGVQQLKRRCLRRWALDARDQKNCIAVIVLTWRTAKGLGLEEGRAAHILSIRLAPINEKGRQTGCNPTQGGFRRSVGAAEVGTKPNGKR